MIQLNFWSISICFSIIAYYFLLLKTEMEAGHGGKSGRDGQIDEIALDYAFAISLKNNIL